MQDYETIICPKCKSVVSTYYGFCPRCDTVFPKARPKKSEKKNDKKSTTGAKPVPKTVDPIRLKADLIADELKRNYVDIGDRQYKKKEIVAHVRDIPSLQLNKEQSYALAVDDQFCLVEARAGSGKTRTIVSKLLYLLDIQHYRPDEVMALSFNRVVREEIADRVNKKFRYKGCGYSERDFDIAKTFHSLAYHAETEHRILDEPVKKELIRDILNCLKLDPFFKSKVYSHFKKESFQLNRSHFTDEKSFYKYLRNLTFTTLKGETVKSLGEKWIADFLYEHGVAYQYEKRFYPSYIKSSVLSCDAAKADEIQAFLQRNIRLAANNIQVRESVIPDFYLGDYSLVIEHWGINEQEQDQKEKDAFSARFDTSWDDYRSKMFWKREFWNSDLRKYIIPAGSPAGSRALHDIKSVVGLVETSVADLSNGREQFESHLQELLQGYGVRFSQCVLEDLEEEVWNRQYTRFAQMMQTFVDKFEQHFPDGDIQHVKGILSTLELDDRQKDFIEIGLTVTEKYYEIIRDHHFPLLMKNKKKYEEYDCDYNQLMANATQSILQGQCDSVICSLKCLLIDEYQDFSQLFYEFIAAILTRNHELKLFCVGDPWQAINRFMGADVKYFENFAGYFPSARHLYITKNYRSARYLVQLANSFMESQHFVGQPAEANSQILGKFEKIDVRDVFVEMRPEKAAYNDDQAIVRLMYDEDKPDPLIPRYLKKIIEILKYECQGRSHSALILSRTKQFRNRFKLEELERQLKVYLAMNYGMSDDKLNHIRVSTIHSSKGDEADTVIILEANRGKMPLVHPDNNLYRIFGESEETALEDEARLFYVAITRAKTSLYILHDDNPSEYLEKLPAGPPPMQWSSEARLSI